MDILGVLRNSITKRPTEGCGGSREVDSIQLRLGDVPKDCRCLKNSRRRWTGAVLGGFQDRGGSCFGC